MIYVYLIQPSLFPALVRRIEADEVAPDYAIITTKKAAREDRKTTVRQPRYFEGRQILFDTHDQARDALITIAKERLQMLRAQIVDTQHTLAVLQATGETE